MSDVAMGESEIKEYIDDYIDLNISYSKLFFKEKNSFTDGDTTSDVIMLGDGILKKYRKELDELLETKKLSHAEQRKYYCNPWVLSYDLYGSVEYWFLILEANHLSSAMELTQETIQVYNGSLPRIIESILALEEEFIDSNEEEMNDDGYGVSPLMLEDEEEDDEDDDDNIEEDDDEE